MHKKRRKATKCPQVGNNCGIIAEQKELVQVCMMTENKKLPLTRTRGRRSVNCAWSLISGQQELHTGSLTRRGRYSEMTLKIGGNAGSRK